MEDEPKRIWICFYVSKVKVYMTTDTHSLTQRNTHICSGITRLTLAASSAAADADTDAAEQDERHKC